MRNVADMKRNKYDKVEELQAILDRAEDAGRKLTMEEDARYKTGLREVRAMEKEILDEEELQAREMALATGGETSRGECRSFGKENLHELRGLYGHAEHGQTFNSWLTGIITGKGETRQDPSTVSAQGTYLVPDYLYGQLVHDAFAKTVCVEAGSRVVDMPVGTMRVPRLTGLPATLWLGELEEHTPRSELSIDGVTLEAAKLSVQIAVSVELYEDSAILRDEVSGILTKALAVELDRAALCGAPNGPTGIANTVGVHQIDNVGTIANWLPLVYAHGLVQQSCYTPSAAVLHPNTWAQFDGLMDTTGQPMAPPPSYATYRKLSTCNLACVDEYEAEEIIGIVGDFRRHFWAVRRGAYVEVSRCADSSWRDYRVEIRAYLRAAPAVITPAAFCVLRDIDELDLTTLPQNG